jgi:enamine deaminase RidA (YjgF/YER057c/UK114 family)
VIEEKLASLDISLPIPPEPVGSYLPVVVSGNLAFVAGQIPIEGNAVKLAASITSSDLLRSQVLLTASLHLSTMPK